MPDHRWEVVEHQDHGAVVVAEFFIRRDAQTLVDVWNSVAEGDPVYEVVPSAALIAAEKSESPDA